MSTPGKMKKKGKRRNGMLLTQEKCKKCKNNLYYTRLGNYWCETYVKVFVK